MLLSRMPTTSLEKNREYVKKSNEKKKEQLGTERYNKYFVANENKYRTNKKEKIGAEECKKQQAEYVKEYCKKQKELKQETKKKEGLEGAINTLTDAIRARKARKELQTLAAAKTEPLRRRRGRPAGSKNKAKELFL
jgi:hypothetical protein